MTPPPFPQHLLIPLQVNLPCTPPSSPHQNACFPTLTLTLPPLPAFLPLTPPTPTPPLIPSALMTPALPLPHPTHPFALNPPNPQLTHTPFTMVTSQDD